MVKSKKNKGNHRKGREELDQPHIPHSINDKSRAVQRGSGNTDEMTPIRRSVRIESKLKQDVVSSFTAKITIPMTRSRTATLTADSAQKEPRKTGVSKRTTKRSARISGVVAGKAKAKDAKQPKKRQNQSIESPVLFKHTRLRRKCSVSICNMKPIIRRRLFPIPNEKSVVHLAKRLLHVSEIPETLPCREKEYSEIFQLIKSKLLDNCGGCMYVCGVPGTGKTATITSVIRSLKLQSNAKTVPQFELIQINGMQLSEPQEVYVHIYHHLKGTKVCWDEAVALLDKLFNKPITAERKLFTILVIDEFEMLKSSGQRVIYNLLNWAMKPSAQLFVVTIGNIIDIERMGGITSRLGATRFTFLPYTQTQLQRIVQARLANLDIYENDAVELVARKVASISGDCRRALDICRRATEIGEKDCVGKKIVVTMSHVVKAFDEMITSPKVIALKGCSKYEKFFLQAVIAEIARMGADETVLFQVYQQFETICALNGVSVLEPGIALRISSKLGSSRLLICEHSCNSINQKIMLNVTNDEMRYAFDLK